MKTLFAKVAEVVAFSLLLLLITAPITKPVWSQYVPQGTIIQGVTSALKVVPVQVDASGALQTAAYPTYSSTNLIGVSTVAANMIPANATRKVLIIQNQDGSATVNVGLCAAVSSSYSGVKLAAAGGILSIIGNAPTCAISVAASAGTSAVSVTEGY